MSGSDSVLFSAGHGFYQFAFSRDIFDRSLYYNLLLQPTLTIPDHYFLQGKWIGEHLDAYRSRDSWIECGLRNGFVLPYFRKEANNLSMLLAGMESGDRRGFGPDAKAIAERLDRTPFKARHWSSSENSASFAKALVYYLTAEHPPITEIRIDPDDFLGFWDRSREWIVDELNIALERSTALLGSEGILLSQLIQVSGERLLGADCGRIESVDDLLGRASDQLGSDAERDLRVFYTCASELYNRSLADTLDSLPNRPRWKPYIAAMDLYDATAERDFPSSDRFDSDLADLDEIIRLPRPIHLRSVSGDALLAIRRSPTCERYFESLAHWRSHPHSEALRSELIHSLRRYTHEIRKQVGKDVGFVGLRPQFISKISDVTRALEKTPGIIQGFLAVGAVGATTGVTTGAVSPLVPAGLFSLFCLQTVAKYYSPSQTVGVAVSPQNGVRLYGDVTISRA
jgi:hypothetical protein